MADINQSLVDSIKNYLNQGIAWPTIETNLLTAGWTKGQVREAFKQLEVVPGVAGQTPAPVATAQNVVSTSAVSSNLSTYIKEFLKPNKFKVGFFLIVYFLPAAFYLAIQQQPNTVAAYWRQSPISLMVSLVSVVIALPVNTLKFFLLVKTLSWAFFFILMVISAVVFWVVYYLLGSLIYFVFYFIISGVGKLFPHSAKAP